MSNSDTSEEKTLPASQRKLKELRKKGQIPHSTDMVSGATTSTGLIFIWLTGEQFIQRFKLATVDITKTDIGNFRFAAARILRTLAISLGSYVAILAILVVCTAILANLLVNQGFLFSLSTLKLDFNRLNPIEGMKRIFSTKSLVALIKNILKLILFLCLSSAILFYNLNVPFFVPFCGPDCFRSALSSLTTPIVGSAIVLFLAFGILDIGVQRWLFLREHKMTKSEAKRERKDEEGAPEIRRSQRRLRQQILRQSAKYTFGDATIFIEGANAIVGVRFVQGETAVPVVVCKGKSRHFSEILDFAIENNRPIYANEELAKGLFEKLEVGNSLSEAFFEPFIRALRALKLV